VDPLPAETRGASIDLTWTGTDDAGGSGIGAYDVYVSVDGGPYTSWLEDHPATTATFTGEFRRTYAFYTIAKDNVGYVEDAPSVPDASTMLTPLWQNTANPIDVNNDTVESPLDALLVINYLNANLYGGNGALPPAPAVPPPFYDVNGDDLVAPLDALLVVNFLNARAAGEGEADNGLSLIARDIVREWQPQLWATSLPSDGAIDPFPYTSVQTATQRRDRQLSIEDGTDQSIGEEAPETAVAWRHRHRVERPLRHRDRISEERGGAARLWDEVTGEYDEELIDSDVLQALSAS
jgi:hypothetical protein